jgi:hypothetical protein
MHNHSGKKDAQSQWQLVKEGLACSLVQALEWDEVETARYNVYFVRVYFLVQSIAYHNDIAHIQTHAFAHNFLASSSTHSHNCP